MGADTDTTWRALLPPSLRSFPADLTAVALLVVLTVGAALLPVVRETPLRIGLGLPFVLFAPGYALVAALFPDAGASPGDDESRRANGPAGSTREGGIDGLERVALSFGASIAVSPLVGVVLNFTPWGIRPVPTLVSLGGVTLVAASVGAQRRAALDPEDRFRVPYERWVAEARAELFEPETRTDAALNVLLAASVLLAVGTVGYVAVTPSPGEGFSEFSLLTERDDGTLVADDYPTEFVVGEPGSLVVGVENREGEPASYTVVSEIQRVRVENNSTAVLKSEPLLRFSPTVGANETWRRQHEVAPTMTGDRLRLTYLLYRGDPPSDPTTANAYRSLHLWVNVTQGTEADEESVRSPSGVP